MKAFRKANEAEVRSRRQARLEARITEAQKLRFERAATVQGRSVTDFVVSAADEAATRILREHGMLTLSERDCKTFVHALLKPPAPRGRLAQAMKRYRRTSAITE
jgi:uncharacterized protein (DUF1778 family)